jgi:hypothetical protein
MKGLPRTSTSTRRAVKTPSRGEERNEAQGTALAPTCLYLRIAVLAFAASLALALALSACGGADAPDGPAESVSGVVVDVQAESLLELSSLKVRDEAGVTWEFVRRGPGGVGELTPSHLRQHGVLGEPVTVTFRREGRLLVIDRITD